MALERRPLGYTEQNWVLACDGGTGVTASAFLFGISLSKPTVQAAVNNLVSAKPFLRAHIRTVNNKLEFAISAEAVLVEAVPYPYMGKSEQDEEDQATEVWWKIVELELNTLFPQTRPTPTFQVRVYNDLPDNSSLVILRSHSAAGDVLSCSTVGSAFLNFLKDVVEKEKSGETIDALLRKVTLDEASEKFQYYPPIEKAVPKGAADKPFWAHGTDVIGYGLVSRRHSYLPFKNTNEQRKSRAIRASLSKEATDRLLKACKDNSANIYGAVSAAGLKSVATFKKVGSKGEHYGVAVLYNCRPLLDPKLPEDSLGFYHSALLKTTHASEKDQFWTIAANLTKDFQESIKKRKHFTDMGNLNLLMVQAIHHPNLTPSSTLRTAMYSLGYEPVIENTPPEAAKVLHLKDCGTVSSIHGVGPCVAIFHAIRDGALQLTFGYCTPLYTRSQVQLLIDSLIGHLSV